MQEAAKPYRRWIGPLLSLLAFALYLVTLSPGAFPGESARLIAEHTGLCPFPAMSHPLWHAAVRWLSFLPWGRLSWRLNVFSAICGAAVVWLVYELAARIPRNRTFEEIEAGFSERRVRSFSGLVAALLLATSIPFWLVSTRAHPAAFDLLWGAGVIAMLLRTFPGPQAGRPSGASVGRLFLLGWLWGLGTTEFATLIVWTPAVALAVVYLLWRADRLRAGVVAGIVLSYLAGLLVYVLYAWEYWLTPAREWRMFGRFFEVLWFVWREQYRAIAKSVPQVGWLLVFLVSVLPGVVLFAFPKRLPTRAARPASVALQMLLTAVGLGVLLNAPIAPWRLLGWSPLLVTPYFLVAIWMGYLAGYWRVVLSCKDPFETPAGAAVRKALYALFYPVCIGLFGLIIARNLPTADGRQARPLLRVVEETVAALGDRGWLITNGALDDNLWIAAAEQGRELHLLNMAASGTRSYREYVASLFADPRLRGLARVGLPALISAWFEQDPEIERKLAVLAHPDLWAAAGREAVPERVLFLGARHFDAAEADQLLERHRAWWQEMAAGLKRGATARGALLANANRWALGHLGKVANNLGVLLEDRGREDLAWECYVAARAMDTNNVSALLNQLSLAVRRQDPGAEELRARVEAELKELGPRWDLWALSYHYGYVRHPDAYFARGLAWVMSGKRNAAIAEVRRALEMGARSDVVQMALASLYLSEEMEEESEKAYQEVLEKDPNRVGAVLGLARVAMRKGDFDAARGYLARLRELKYPPGLLALEEIALASLMGRPAEARAIAEGLVKQDPENLKAWTALALLAASEGDSAQVEKCMRKLESAGASAPSIRLAMAQMAIKMGDEEAAARHVEAVLQRQPAHREALELLVQVRAKAGVRRDLEDAVERLLTVDPDNALGNFVLAGLQVARGETALAEASLRTSLKARRTPEALNELAWLLQKRGAYREALPLAEEAVSLNDRNPAAWDTLGVILLELGRLDEAEKALNTALALRPEWAVTLYHVGLLLERKGLSREALELVEPLQARAAEIDPDSFADLRRLVARLRERS